MNKNQFLIELNQYLTFLSPAERTEIISGYTAKFDSVSEEGQAALILSLGTPTKIAIDLKRQKESGIELVPAEKETQEEDESTKSVPEAMETISDPEAELEAGDDSLNGSKSQPETETETVKKRSLPASLGAALLAIIVSVFFLALVGIGVYFVVIMGNLLLTGLQSLSNFSNALLLFGCGLVAGALGIVLIWLAIWSAIKLIAHLFKMAACGRKA